MNIAFRHDTPSSITGIPRGRPGLRWGSRAWRWRYPFLFVVLPTLLAAVYYGLIAAPIYLSESKFVVRYTAPPASNAFGSLLNSAGITRSQDDTFSVQDFLQSRDALARLEQAVDVRGIFSTSQADWFARFPQPWAGSSFESLYRYYGSRVKVTHNATSGITTLTTTAFRAQDTYALNKALLDFGSALLGRMNERAREDAVRFAQSEVRDAERRLVAAQGAITTFRNRQEMVDPGRISTTMLDLIGRLASELATARARLTETSASAPDSTALPLLSSRISALEQQIGIERAKLVGSDVSVAPRIAEYEGLVLERELASKMLTSTANSLDAARADARRQQLYLEPVVAPRQPEEAELPYRSLTIIVVFVSAAISFVIGWLVLAAARDYLRG